MFLSCKNKIWHVKNKKFYDEYNKKCHKVKRRTFIQKEKSRIVGENTIGATILIIKSFVPQIWIIENPATSKVWDFQKNHLCFYGNHNKTYYSSYDSTFSSKPTIFKSNLKLTLDKKRIHGNNDHMARGNYDKRSAIPLNLIKVIMLQCIERINNHGCN